MNTFQTILVIVYLVSFIYYSIQLGREMKTWHVYGKRDFSLLIAMIFSFIGAFVPILNTYIAIKLFQENKKI